MDLKEHVLDRHGRRRKFVLEADSCMYLIYERITRSNVRDALSSRLLCRDRPCSRISLLIHVQWDFMLSWNPDMIYVLPGKKDTDNVTTKYIENPSLI